MSDVDENLPEPFTCPRCGKQSWHPQDKAQGYCGACHDWTGGAIAPIRLYGQESKLTGSDICDHCGRVALGYAKVGKARVCHHEERDCYQAVTVWGQTLGNRVTWRSGLRAEDGESSTATLAKGYDKQ